jgi:hypothetical protein
MFALPEFADEESGLISAFALQQVSTWMGEFGHPMPKPTHLLTNLPDSKELESHMSLPKQRELMQKSKRAGKRFYKRDATGGVTGDKDLADSAVYTEEFCQAALKVWLKAKKA